MLSIILRLQAKPAGGLISMKQRRRAITIMRELVEARKRKDLDRVQELEFELEEAEEARALRPGFRKLNHLTGGE